MKPLETDTLYPTDKNEIQYKGKNYLLKEYATIIEVEDATVIGTYQEEFYAHTPAITKHVYGKGDAYYIGGRLEHSFYEDFYGQLIEELNLKPKLVIQHDKGVSVQTRQTEEEDITFVMNFSEEEQKIVLTETVKDSLNDTILSGEVILEPYGFKVLSKK